MTRIFFLGPGYFEGDAERGAFHRRLHLAESLDPHEVIILEISDIDAPDLTAKFKAAMAATDAVVVWLPARGELSTVFGELLLLRYENDWHGRRVTIFAENGVLDMWGGELRVLHRSGQIAFLRDLPKHYDLEVFEYDSADELADLFRMYADNMLDT